MNNIMLPEIEYGNIEYKRKLSPDMSRVKSLITQLLWRLEEGSGTAIYYIGLDDDGSCYGIDAETYSKSYAVLSIMCKQINAYIYNEIMQVINNKHIYKLTIMTNNHIINEQRILIVGKNRNKYASQLIYDNDSCVNRVYNYEHEHNFGIKSLIVKHIGISDSLKIMNFKTCHGIYNIKEKSSLILALFILPDNRSIKPYVKFIHNVVILNDNETEHNIELCKQNKLSYNVVDNANRLHNIYNAHIMRDTNFGSRHKCIYILSIIKQTNNSYIVLILSHDQIVKIGDYFNGFIHINEPIAFITIESLRYFNTCISKIDKNVTFTALIHSKADIRKYKRFPLIKT